MLQMLNCFFLQIRNIFASLNVVKNCLSTLQYFDTTDVVQKLDFFLMTIVNLYTMKL
jgi:hypothetical protein